MEINDKAAYVLARWVLYLRFPRISFSYAVSQLPTHLSPTHTHWSNLLCHVMGSGNFVDFRSTHSCARFKCFDFSRNSANLKSLIHKFDECFAVVPHELSVGISKDETFVTPSFKRSTSSSQNIVLARLARLPLSNWLTRRRFRDWKKAKWSYIGNQSHSELHSYFIFSVCELSLEATNGTNTTDCISV
jgi:hypothetical protein